jgi:hypothetical protein
MNRQAAGIRRAAFGRVAGHAVGRAGEVFAALDLRSSAAWANNDASQANASARPKSPCSTLLDQAEIAQHLAGGVVVTHVAGAAADVVAKAGLDGVFQLALLQRLALGLSTSTVAALTKPGAQ